MDLMTLYDIAAASGHRYEALRMRKQRGRLGIEPLGRLGSTDAYDGAEARAWIAANKKSD